MHSAIDTGQYKICEAENQFCNLCIRYESSHLVPLILHNFFCSSLFHCFAHSSSLSNYSALHHTLCDLFLLFCILLLLVLVGDLTITLNLIQTLFYKALPGQFQNPLCNHEDVKLEFFFLTESRQIDSFSRSCNF